MERQLEEYDALIRQIRMAAAQIDVLSEYDQNPERKEERALRFFDSSHYGIEKIRINDSHRLMKKLISDFNLEIKDYRGIFPVLEEDEKVREKLRELERLGDSGI